MMCDECKRHLGAHASRHPHSNLAAPGHSVPVEFRSQRFSTLYCCRACKSILSRGRNTGWTQASAVVPTVPVAPAITGAAGAM